MNPTLWIPIIHGNGTPTPSSSPHPLLHSFSEGRLPDHSPEYLENFVARVSCDSDERGLISPAMKPGCKMYESISIYYIVDKRHQLVHEHRVKPFLHRKKDTGNGHDPEFIGNKVNEL